MEKRLKLSILTIIENARRLLSDAEFLDFMKPPYTAYFLAIIAQEELAKAFLLGLVYRNIIPWDQRILRATRDHTSKQLLCIVMEYLDPEIDEYLDRLDAIVLRHERTQFPSKVADALNILRYEKIGRWESKKNWVWAEDPAYDRDALAVSEGKLDRSKQDALYVRLSANGGIVPSSMRFSGEIVQEEIERAGRFLQIAEAMIDPTTIPGLSYDSVEEAFRLLFAR